MTGNYLDSFNSKYNVSISNSNVVETNNVEEQEEEDALFVDLLLSFLKCSGNQCGTLLEHVEDDIAVFKFYSQITGNNPDNNEKAVLMDHQSFSNVVKHTSSPCHSTALEVQVMSAIRAFAGCTKIDLQDLAALFNPVVTNQTLHCATELFTPWNGYLEPSGFCVEDPSGETDMNCTNTIVHERSPLGNIARVLLTKTDLFCRCMPILGRVPACSLVWDGHYIDGGRIKNYACAYHGQCKYFDCHDRLETLDQCLPSLNQFKVDATLKDNCKSIMCGCEATPTNSTVNYAAQFMELPMSDTCISHACRCKEEDLVDVPRRYTLFQSMCGFTSSNTYDEFINAKKEKRAGDISQYPIVRWATSPGYDFEQCGVNDHIEDDLKTADYLLDQDAEMDLSDPDIVASFANVVAHTSPRCSEEETVQLEETWGRLVNCVGMDMNNVTRDFDMSLIQTYIECSSEFFDIGSNQNRISTLCGGTSPQKYHVLSNGVGGTCEDLITSNTTMGQFLRLLITEFGRVCNCLSLLEADVPECHVTYGDGITDGIADGGRMKKYSCVVQSRSCSWNERSCPSRLRSLDRCLPTMDDFTSTDRDFGSCEEIRCRCEAHDDGWVKYSAKMMELPILDMCIETAKSSWEYQDVPKRYELLQTHCGFHTDTVIGKGEGQIKLGGEGLILEEGEVAIGRDSGSVALVCGLLSAALVFIILVICNWIKQHPQKPSAAAAATNEVSTASTESNIASEDLSDTRAEF